MRAVIRRHNVKIEFSGRGQLWNELLRPYRGGPEAPPEPVPSARVATAPAQIQVPVQLVAAAPVRQAAPAPMPQPASALLQASGAGATRPPVSQPRTWYPPRPATPQRFEPRYPVAAPPAGGDDDESDAV